MDTILKIILITTLLLTMVNSYDLSKLKDNSKKDQFSKDTVAILYDTKAYEKPNKDAIINKIIFKKQYKEVYETKIVNNYQYPWFRIKSGWVNSPYLYLSNNNTNVKVIKQNINKEIVKNDIVSKEVNKESSKIKNKIKKVVVNKDIKTTKLSYSNFVGVSLGYSYMDAKKQKVIGDIALNEAIDKSGININIEAGMRTKNYTYTLNYTNLVYDDVKFDRFLIGINRVFNQYRYKPYIGLLSGLSYIEITKAHFNTNIPKAMGKEYAYGVQGGLEYKLNDNLSIHTYLRYLRANHTTILKSNPALAKINRDNHINLNIGLRYNLY